MPNHWETNACFGQKPLSTRRPEPVGDRHFFPRTLNWRPPLYQHQFLDNLQFFSVSPQERHGKTCFGTASKLSVGLDRVDHYIKMVSRYTNCTTVEGNLEITGLESPTIDVSFLKVSQEQEMPPS